MSAEDTKDRSSLEMSETKLVSVNEICRLCANQSDRLVHVYSEEGISNDLATKVNMYLPIKVSEDDELPLQCCWGCASTLLAWHELVEVTVEADRRLRKCQFITTTKIVNSVISDYDSSNQVDLDEPDIQECDSHVDDDREGPQRVTTSLNAFCQTQNETATSTDEIKGDVKNGKSLLPIYFTTTDGSDGDHFDNYISGLEHPLITDTSLHQNQSIINFKNEEDLQVMKMDDKYTSTTEFYNLSEHNAAGDEENVGFAESTVVDSEECFDCYFCPSLFTLKEDLLTHFKEAHPDEEMPFEERKPEEKCERKPERKLEERKPKVKKEKRRNLKIDQAKINEARISVDGRVYYNCKQCGKSLHSPYTYIWHMRIHTGERPFVCDLCGKQFRVSQGLIRHVRETHEGVKNFPCDLCGRMFASRRNVEEHRRIHTNERPYICDLCGKTFKQKASLFVHNRSHTDSFPFKCGYCNQGFRTKPPLLLHVTRHTGEKPYPCDVCGRKFRIKYELKRHKLIHSDEKPFSCDLCGLNFRQKRYLKNHIKVNHNDMVKSESVT